MGRGVYMVGTEKWREIEGAERWGREVESRRGKYIYIYIERDSARYTNIRKIDIYIDITTKIWRKTHRDICRERGREIKKNEIYKRREAEIETIVHKHRSFKLDCSGRVYRVTKEINIALL